MSCRTHFFFQAEDGIRDYKVTGVQTCALPICAGLPFLGVSGLGRGGFGRWCAGGAFGRCSSPIQRSIQRLLPAHGGEKNGQAGGGAGHAQGGEEGDAPQARAHGQQAGGQARSEEHTSELQSPCNLVCRLLLEKKKKNRIILDALYTCTHTDRATALP